MKLYELTENYNRVLDLANDPDVDPQVIEDTLGAIEGAIEGKAENIAKLIKCIDADVNALKEISIHAPAWGATVNESR